MDASVDTRQDEGQQGTSTPDLSPAQDSSPAMAGMPEAPAPSPRAETPPLAEVAPPTNQSAGASSSGGPSISATGNQRAGGAAERPPGNDRQSFINTTVKDLDEASRIFRQRHFSSSPVVSDLSRSFDHKGDLLPIEKSKIRQWVDDLQKYRIIVLQSEAPLVLTSAARLIVESSFSKGEARSWTFNDPSVAKATVFDIVAARESTNSSPTLNVMCTYEGSAREFLASLPVDPYSKLEKDLESKNALMLVLTTPKLLQNQDQAEYDYVEEPISWLEPLLYSVLREQGVALAQEIAHKWPYSWRRTREFAASGKLLEVIEKLQHPATGDHFHAGNGTELADDQPLENSIRFVTCFFGGSEDGETFAPEDFQRVLRVILADQSIEEPVQVVSEQGNTITKQVKKTLIEIWAANSQRLAAKCGVSIFREPGEVPYLDFINPGQREVIIRSFETDHIWTFDDLCRRVQEAGMIFDAKRSVRSGAARLILRKITYDPSGFGRTFLADLTRDLQRPFTSQTYEGLNDLMDALVSANLAEPVKSSLLHLMDLGNYREAWILALRLRTSTAFRPTFALLFRRALDEGDEELRSDARKLALIWLERLTSTAEPAIAEILSWALNEGIAAAAPSRRFAFDIAFNFLRAIAFSALSLPAGKRLEYPPEWFELLVKCLLHDSLDQCFPAVLLGANLCSDLATWMLSLELDDTTPDPVISVAYACWADALLNLPVVVDAKELANYFRAIVAIEWGRLSQEQPESKSKPVDILRGLLTNKQKKRVLRDNIQILAGAAGAGYCAVDLEKWETPEQRDLRKTLKTQLRGIREAARYARIALGE